MVPLSRSTPQLLGEIGLELTRFDHLSPLFEEWSKPAFMALPERKRFAILMRSLLDQILEAPEEAFLLRAALDFLSLVNTHRLIEEKVRFHHWEFWLNQFSGLDEETQGRVRGKLVGKFIPRQAYQGFFPVGTGKSYFGSHFVAAHLSPDVDTLIASFWGWVDAFGAKLGQSQHHWSLPGGPPDSPVTTVFKELFGEQVFDVLARTGHVLTLNAIDLVSQVRLHKEIAPTSLNTLDPGLSGKAVVLVDEQDHFLGDWRFQDTELVRQVVILFKSCLHWFENNLHLCLVSFFAKEEVTQLDVIQLLHQTFTVTIGECEPVREFSSQQLRDLDLFLCHVMGQSKGLKASFSDLSDFLDAQGMPGFSQVRKQLQEIHQQPFFDDQSLLKDARKAIFHFLEEIIQQIDRAIYKVRDYVERLDVAIAIKNQIIGMPSPTLSLRSDVDEMLAKIKQYDYLTVLVSDAQGKSCPIGVVWASDLRRQSLGTVSFRDFSTEEEVRMASYLTPISLVDHHKSNVQTTSVPAMLIGDVQSCNVLVAEVAFQINDQYSLGGVAPEQLEKQIKALKAAPSTSKHDRLLSRLLGKQQVLLRRGAYFVQPQREFAEYLTFLYAILDDTDLLTKVTPRDVECVAGLLNRMKTLVSGEESEVIDFDAIPRDQNFARAAAKLILQNEEMYSLYKRIYQVREQEVDAQLQACRTHVGSLFADTKEQNGCCRVGQTKLFTHNISVYQTVAEVLRSLWLETAQAIFKNKPEVDLYLHMISTIPSTEEVYRGDTGNYVHLDELWLWIPNTQLALDHLATFLYAFQTVPEVIANAKGIVIEGGQAARYQEVFKHNFLVLPIEVRSEVKRESTLAVLRYKAGALNSRKALVSPYLPRLLSV